MARYAELHAHTNFSFLDGATHPHELVETAAELGYEALAVTDHHGFQGAVYVATAAAEAGLPIVYGTEITVPLADTAESDPFADAEHADLARWQPTVPEARRRGRTTRAHDTTPVGRPPGDHLVLLATGPDGYAGISRLVSRAHLRGAKGRPRYTWGDLAEVAATENVVALTGCWQGAVPRAAARGDLDGALAEAARLRSIFGSRLHVEIWDHRMPDDDLRNDVLAMVAERLALPLVATNQVHYADPGDADLADVLAAISGRRDLAVADGYRLATDERYLKAPETMHRRMAAFPGAVATAAQLGRDLAFDLRLMAPGLPPFPVPDGFADEQAFLRHLVYEGAREAYPDGAGGVDPAAARRLDHELDVIGRLDFPGYFLVVWDLVNFARERRIMCQIRGSGADSAVCRCIGLTRVDPIRLGLPFERFLSEERGRAPDIDIDFEADRREEVIQYCYRTYGRERAAMVANVITYRARNVLRDVARTFGFTPAQVNGLSRYLDTRSPERIRDLDPLPAGLTAEQVYDLCVRLDGFPRHLGIHSGGMVIADRPLHEVVPLEWGRMEGRSVLQWDKDSCGAIGVVKFDLLGLGMLNALHLTVDLIAETHGHEIDLATIPQEPAVYRQLTNADTVGLFQVESRAQMATLPKMKPTTFYDLAVEVALIRPGPIQGHSVHPYLRRRNGHEPVRYPHPLAEPVLAKTLGVPIFQEQLMELARVCAGFDPSQVDRLRQAMTHKRSEQAMAALRDEVYEGMAGRGITGAGADEIWEKLQGFGEFGFPESHSVSFAYIVYMSAWLRHHYPAEFLAGLLNAQPMGFYSPNTLVHDAKRHGVTVLGPDVNASFHDATVEPHDIPPEPVEYLGLTWIRGRGAAGDPERAPVAVRMGLASVRGLGDAEITRLELARAFEGPFADAVDLAGRTGLRVEALEALAASGALESIGMGRRDGLWAAGALAELGPGRLPVTSGIDAPTLPGLGDEETAELERWAMGVSLEHPLRFIRDRLAAIGCVPCAEVTRPRRPGRVRVGGAVTHRQRPHTARGVIFFNLEDETGLLNVVVHPEVWDRHWEVARKQAGLVVEGHVEQADGVTNLVAHRFEPLPIAGMAARNFR